MKKVKLTNEEFNYLDNLIIVINSKLGLIKSDESCEDGMDGGIRGLLFSIQANLTYPESEEGFINNDGRKVVLKSWSGYLFCHKKIRQFLKIFHSSKFCGRIVAHGVFEK